MQSNGGASPRRRHWTLNLSRPARISRSCLKKAFHRACPKSGPVPNIIKHFTGHVPRAGLSQERACHKHFRGHGKACPKSGPAPNISKGVLFFHVSDSFFLRYLAFANVCNLAACSARSTVFISVLFFFPVPLPMPPQITSTFRLICSCFKGKRHCEHGFKTQRYRMQMVWRQVRQEASQHLQCE